MCATTAQFNRSANRSAIALSHRPTLDTGSPNDKISVIARPDLLSSQEKMKYDCQACPLVALPVRNTLADSNGNSRTRKFKLSQKHRQMNTRSIARPAHMQAHIPALGEYRTVADPDVAHKGLTKASNSSARTHAHVAHLSRHAGAGGVDRLDGGGDVDEVAHVRDVEHAGVSLRTSLRGDHVHAERREAAGRQPERGVARLKDSCVCSVWRCFVRAGHTENIRSFRSLQTNV